jgi:hypothetical protein
MVSQRSRRLAGLVLVALGCGGSPGGSVNVAPAATSEPFAVREVHDAAQGGMLAGVVSAPASWKVDVNIAWNYEDISAPLQVTSSFVNPASPEAVFGFGSYPCFDLQPRGYFQPGRRYGGLLYARPQPPVGTLAGFVREARHGADGLRFVGSKDLPDLPAAMRLPPSPDQHGVGVKVAYDLDGKPIEEEFYAVHYVTRIPYDGPQGRTWQINWGLADIHSFRAPAGTLDRRRPVFAAVAKSFHANPAWEARVKAVDAYLADQFNRQLQAGYDQIAAAGAVSRQISANNDAMIANIDQQLASSGATPTARAESDQFDDYIRGVETVADPYYGTSQQDANAQYHWTDGYGGYRDANDPTYDPNHTEVGSWTPMQP